MSSPKVPERYDKCLLVSYSVKEKSLSTSPMERKWATSQTANVGGDGMNPEIRNLPESSTNGILGERMSR